VFAPQPLAQDNGILRADGGNQTKGHKVSVDQGGHGLSFGSPVAYGLLPH
jgi:hypothetical protein